MSQSKADRKEKLTAIVEELSEDEQRLLNRFIKAEKAKLHMGRPRDIQDDLWKALTETIR